MLVPDADPHAVLAVSLGGGLGAGARYGIAEWLPESPGTFPWATMSTNIVGCAAIGILMVLITEVWVVHPLIRPFLGVGVLGGFTTFSTYSAQIRDLLEFGSVGTALGYCGATLLACLGAVALGMRAARWITR